MRRSLRGVSRRRDDWWRVSTLPANSSADCQRPSWKTAWSGVYVERLVPRAVQALVTAWSKGNPSGAVEVLRSAGCLRPAEIRVDTREPALLALHRVLADLPAEVRALVAERLDRLEEH